MKTTVTRAACCLLGVVLTTLLLPACEQQSDELARAQKIGEKQATRNVIAHEKRLLHQQK